MKRKRGPRAEVKYVFWVHAPVGKEYAEHPILQVEKILRRELSKGRKYHVLCVESSNISQEEKRKVERGYGEEISKIRRMFSQLRRHKIPEELATGYSFERATEYNAPSLAGELVLAAKYGLKLKFIEAYSEDEFRGFRRTKRRAGSYPGIYRHIENRDLNAARNAFVRRAAGDGLAGLKRHYKMLDFIPRIVSEEAGRKHVFRALALLGNAHYPIVLLHRQMLPELPASHEFAQRFPNFVRRANAFTRFLKRMANRVSAGKGVRLHWANHAVLYQTAEQDFRKAFGRKSRKQLQVFSGAEGKQTLWFESPAAAPRQTVVATANRIVETTQEDFPKIAERYRRSKRPFHEVLAEYWRTRRRK